MFDLKAHYSVLLYKVHSWRMQTERKQRKSAFYTFERQENYAQSALPPFVSVWVQNFVEVRYASDEF